jgi:hypothetical protein
MKNNENYVDILQFPLSTPYVGMVYSSQLINQHCYMISNLKLTLYSD